MVKSKKIIFISREGRDEPGARIRSYYFSQVFKEKGLNPSVLSFVDNLGARAGRNEANFTVHEKLKLFFKALRFLNSTKDLIFVVNRFNYHAFSPWLFSFLKNTPYVFDMDDWEAKEDVGKHFGFIPKSGAESLVRIFAKKSKFCVGASHYLKDYLSKFNKNVYYLPTGVMPYFFDLKPSYKNEGNIIFSWHGLINNKDIVNNLEFAINCFLELSKKHKNVEFWVKGDGIYLKEFLIMLEKYSNPHVKYFGWSDPLEIPAYLDEIDIGLFPLIDSSRVNLSKSPTKVFESMARGKLVIASKVGEVEHILDDGNTGLLAKDKHEFISCMEQAVESFDLREKIGSNAFNESRSKYSADILGERFYNIFIDNFS